MYDDPFYVRREECWGRHPCVWVVWDRHNRRQAAKPLKGELPARRLCNRMNDDWRRYRIALFEKARTSAAL